MEMSKRKGLHNVLQKEVDDTAAAQTLATEEIEQFNEQERIHNSGVQIVSDEELKRRRQVCFKTAIHDLKYREEIAIAEYSPDLKPRTVDMEVVAERSGILGSIEPSPSRKTAKNLAALLGLEILETASQIGPVDNYKVSTCKEGSQIVYGLISMEMDGYQKGAVMSRIAEGKIRTEHKGMTRRVKLLGY